ARAGRAGCRGRRRRGGPRPRSPRPGRRPPAAPRAGARGSRAGPGGSRPPGRPCRRRPRSRCESSPGHRGGIMAAPAGDHPAWTTYIPCDTRHMVPQGSSGGTVTLENWEEQLRRGGLELAIFLSVARAPRYGLEILRHLEGFTDLVVTEGTIYPLLARLT